MLESKLSELGNVGVALMMLEASFTLLHTQTLRHTHTQSQTYSHIWCRVLMLQLQYTKTLTEIHNTFIHRFTYLQSQRTSSIGHCQLTQQFKQKQLLYLVCLIYIYYPLLLFPPLPSSLFPSLPLLSPSLLTSPLQSSPLSPSPFPSSPLYSSHHVSQDSNILPVAWRGTMSRGSSDDFLF